MGTGNIYVLDADVVWNTDLSIKIKIIGLVVTVTSFTFQDGEFHIVMLIIID